VRFGALQALFSAYAVAMLSLSSCAATSDDAFSKPIKGLVQFARTALGKLYTPRKLYCDLHTPIWPRRLRPWP